MSTVSAVLAVFAVVYFFDPLFHPKNEHPNREIGARKVRDFTVSEVERAKTASP
jgi:hypothetical protein